MADVKFVDPYVEARRALGLEDLFAWRTPEGEVYYGATPRTETGVANAGVQRVTTKVLDGEGEGPTDGPGQAIPTPVPVSSSENQPDSSTAGGADGGGNTQSGNDQTGNKATDYGNKASAIAGLNMIAQSSSLNTGNPTIDAFINTVSQLETQNALAAGVPQADIDAVTSGKMTAAEAIQSMFDVAEEENSFAGSTPGPTGGGQSGTGSGTAGAPDGSNDVGIGDANIAADTAESDAAAAASASSAGGQSGTGPGEATGVSGGASGGASGGVSGAAASAAEAEAGGQLAEGGEVVRGQVSTDPVAPPAAAPPGKADDLKRSLSEGEQVVPADQVAKIKAAGLNVEEEIQKLVHKAEKMVLKNKQEAGAQNPQQQAGAQPALVPPAPSSNEQPTTSGSVALPQQAGAQRRIPAL
jgi:hypothetical protein